MLEKGPNNNDKKVSKELMQALSFFSQIGITIVACVLVGVLVGSFLDKLFGTTPWLLLFFSFCGVGAAFKSIFEQSRKK